MTISAGIAVGVALGVVCGLALLLRTGWLQSNTLQKCVVLSLLLHLVVVGGWTLFGARDGGAAGAAADSESVTVVLVVEDEVAEAAEPAAREASAELAGESSSASIMPPDSAEAVTTADAGEPAGASAEPPPPPLLEASLPPEPAAAVAAEGQPLEGDMRSDIAAGLAAAVRTAGLPRPAEPASALSEADRFPPPVALGPRTGPARRRAVLAWGGSDATEAAVAAALGWLARTQSADGRWDASRYAAGRVVGPSLAAHGGHGPESGRSSDHGVTGLALLAFLAAGHTPEAGPYADVVDRGMRFLAERQRADGSLAGPAAFFAELYCHGMATLAVAECYALTGDPALRPVLRRAIVYTVSRQHPTTGGWRYAAGDRGDTSQLGWQLMALASSRQLGLAEAAAAEEASRGFLDTVTSGRRAGLASYRPGERPTPAMTAEALYARLLLGLSPESPTVAEAAAFLDQHRPGRSRVDSYAWYYGTLALFHVGGEPWQRWNSGLQQTLLSLQRTGTGSPVGSWDPDAAWGRHGGRVYATALAALMLEVYYRYQPLHRASGKSRPKQTADQFGQLFSKAEDEQGLTR